MKTYSHSEMIETTGLTRGRLNNLIVHGVLSNVKPAGTGRHRDYSERNLGEVYVALALFDAGVTIPEAARLIKLVSADESKAVAQKPDGRFVLIIVDGKPFLYPAAEEMHKSLKWSRSLQVVKIKRDGGSE